MRKIFFFCLMALALCVDKVSAQSSMLATLTHDGNVSIFYGAKALQEAHAAASNGDVITLSSGTFVSTNITKAVTLRGAGMEVDSIHGTNPTVITGNFTINIPDTVTKRLTLEGLYHNFTMYYNQVKNPNFLKCRFKDIVSTGNRSLKDANFIHCKIMKGLELYPDCSASLINSVVVGPCSNSSSTANFEFVNCLILKGNYGIYSVLSSSFTNCVIAGNSSNDYISSSCTAYHNIGIGDASFFKNIPNTTNRISSYENVFKSLKSLSINDSQNLELTETAKSQYLGTDGKEVGIYGGMLPFDPTPSNPQITKCNVAAKSTADGKLSVDIEVKAAE